jgi:hypothetical protein
VFAYLIGLSWAAKHESKHDANAWPLVLLFVPLVPTIGVVTDGAGLVVWLGFLLFTVKQVGPLLERHPARSGRAIGSLIAGIALLDATLIAHAGHPTLAFVAAVGFAATMTLQRWIRGT